jgi:acid phosphatase (class A)
MSRTFSAIFLVLGLVPIARAADLQFLQPAAADVVALLPPPPATGSKEANSELEVVLKLQATRSAADVARAKAEEKLTPAAFQQVMGGDFTREKFPKLYTLLEDAGNDSKVFSDKAKDQFGHPRPQFVDAHVQPVIDGEVNPSYPSGHSTRGTLWACLLAEVAPDKKAALLKRGQEIGWDRVIAGVHFPSDVYAGRVLGQTLAHALLKSADFQSRLTQAKAEYASRGKQQGAQLEAVESR